MPTAEQYRLNFINACLEGDTSTTFKVIKEVNQLTLNQEDKAEFLEMLNKILAFQMQIKNQTKDTKNLIKLLFLCSYADFPQTQHFLYKLDYPATCSKSANYIKQELISVMSEQLQNKEYVFKFELPGPLILTPIESDKLANLVNTMTEDNNE